jgi:O-antigen/teichoic acid export membrane protein
MASLSTRVIRGGLWMVALNGTGRLLGMVRLIILARLLTPRDFGLVGIALVVMSLFQSFSTTGMQLALIQRKARGRELFDTAWTVGLIRGGVVTGLLLVVAPLVGAFFESTDAVPIVRAMAFAPFIQALTNIGVVEFRRELTFGPYYVFHTSGIVADLCVAALLALWRADAWALVGGWLSLTVVRVAVSYWLHPYRPALRVDVGEAKQLLAYGRWIFGSTAIEWFITNGVDTVVGRLLGVPALGLYQMAWRVASLPITEVTNVTSGVTMAAYAKLQDSTVRVRLAYLKVLTAVALTVVPIAVGVGLYAEDIVRILLGERWDSIVPIVEVLALLGLFRSIGATAGPVFQGLGRPGAQTCLAVVELGVLAVLVVPAALWMGPVGAASASTLAAMCGAAAAMFGLHRHLAVRAGQLAPILGWPLVACLPSAVLRVWLPRPLDSWLELAGILVLSGIVYAAALVLLDRFNLYTLRAALPETRAWLRARD